MPTMGTESRLAPRDSDCGAVTVPDFRRLAVTNAGRDRLISGGEGVKRLWGRFCFDFDGVSPERAFLRLEFARLAVLLTVFLARLRSVVRLESRSFM